MNSLFAGLFPGADKNYEQNIFARIYKSILLYLENVEDAVVGDGNFDVNCGSYDEDKVAQKIVLGQSH